jgi:two-component system, cell cycle response regulator
VTSGATRPGHILVVDDNPVNRMLLTRALESQGYAVGTANDGEQALDMLRSGDGATVDIVLLDILMPEMDGYETLRAIKQDDRIQHIPIIMITAVDEMDSVIRCIEMGATDYLPKPFNNALLQARISASLSSKRLRDLEIEYLIQFGHVIDAAGQVEAGTFDLSSIESVARRDDAIGRLARVFGQMAHEVRSREERLKQQVRELRIEIDEARQTRKVAEITETDYFRQLRDQAADLRRIIESGE